MPATRPSAQTAAALNRSRSASTKPTTAAHRPVAAATFSSASRFASDETGLQEQVLGRIAGDGELREHGDVATAGLGSFIRIEDPGGVAVEISDDCVELAEGHADPRHVSQRTEEAYGARLRS